MSGLTREDITEALVEYVTDAVTFGSGASVETAVGLGRWDGPESIAREFVQARLPVEVEAIVARAVNEALTEVADAIEAGVLSSHPNEGYRHGHARAALIVREHIRAT